MARGQEREPLERLAAELGLSGRTRFTGFAAAAERDALLSDSRVCVCPSVKEGWGITIVEANARGTPAVATAAPMATARPGSHTAARPHRAARSGPAS